MWKTGEKCKTTPFWQQWMARSDLLVPETSTHTTLSMRHTTFLPGFSQWPAQHRDSPWASSWALAVFIPELSLLKSLFLSAGVGSCHKLNEHRCCFFQMPELYTAHHRSTNGLHWHQPWWGEGLRKGVCGVLSSGTFSGDLESTLLSSERLQKSKLLKCWCTQINSPVPKKKPYADERMGRFPSAYNTLHRLTHPPEVETLAWSLSTNSLFGSICYVLVTTIFPVFAFQ